MKLAIEKIRENCNKASYQKGEKLYYNGEPEAIEFASVERNIYALRCTVFGDSGNEYSVRLRFRLRDDDLSPESYSCQCLAFRSYYNSGMCKHCVAAALALSDILADDENIVEKEEVSSKELTKVLAMYSAAGKDLELGIKPSSVHVEPILVARSSRYYGTRITLECKIGTNKRMYVVKSLPRLIYSILNCEMFEYGKALTFCHTMESFDEESRQLIPIIESVVRNSVTYPEHTGCNYGSDYRTMHVDQGQMAAILKLYTNKTISLNSVSCTVKEGDPPLSITMKERGEGADILFPVLMKLCSAPFGYYYHDGIIYHCSDSFMEKVIPFMTSIGAIGEHKECKLYLSQKDYQSFCGNILPWLTRFFTVDYGEVSFDGYIPDPAKFNFYLSLQDENLSLRPEVSYGTVSWPLFEENGEYRDSTAELSVKELVNRYFPNSGAKGHRTAADDDGVYEFLLNGMDKLREAGELYIDNSLKGMSIISEPRINVGVALRGNLIDLSINSDDLPPEEVGIILGAYAQKKKYVKLKSGQYLTLSDGGLSVMAEMTEGLQISYDKNGKATVPGFRAQYIDRMLEDAGEQVEISRNLTFRKQVKALKQYTDSDFPIPESINADLRAYQQTGYRWLCTLSQYGLGGILADDMGLGKTLQTIAYFVKQGGRGLVVCPASLLYNWESECKKFAPELPVRLIKGTASERKTAVTDEDGLFVTSYDLLKRDVELYKNKHFDCCIIDEAQYIRNAGTKAARAVKLVNADHRFALTGTPIENRLSDLWSIFDFLMPGYLYGYERFRKELENPAVQGDKAAIERIQKMVSPFILRRSKKEVLKELPDKIESIQYVDLTPEQMKLYRAQEQAVKYSIMQTSQEDFSKKKIQILAALTRLRQLCCTPDLYLENYEGGSGKVEACLEMLSDAAESGHKTLVFSQFTTMLEALMKPTEEMGLKCLYLSGKNNKEERRDMVEAFQSGEYDVFFISLKAGGTGLNLTAADRVIHFDPWWNYAAEEQATDRTHRIGQDKVVYVTKLVAKDTIEERIIALQEAKRSLSDSVITGEQVSSGSLDRNELMELLSGE